MEKALDCDPDLLEQPAIALNVDGSKMGSEIPWHHHRKGQLVVSLHGAVTCYVPSGIWMVPPRCGVWIPSGMPHSNRITPNGRICNLFIEPSAVGLPAECCTLSLTPLVIELIQHLATTSPFYDSSSRTARVAGVLLEEIADMPIEQLYLPTSGNTRLQKIANQLMEEPSDRSTIVQWASRVALSERSLARLVSRETGLTFGRWRQQLHIIVALQMLASGASVQYVSDQLGYESVSAFITMFKKMLGKPPARYMQERLNVQAI